MSDLTGYTPERTDWGKIALRWLLFVILGLFALWYLAPLFVMLTPSVKTLEEIRTGSLIFTVGAVVLAVSQNFATLLVGRFIIGVAVGLASMAVPLYIAEAAPPDKRGTLVTVNNVFVTGGQFIACVVDALFSKVDYPHGWRFMLGLAAVPAVIQFIGFLFLPESPRWLAKHKGAPAARRVLQKIRGTQAVDAELEMIVASIRADQGVASSGLMTALREAPLRRAMALGCSASSKLC